MENTKEINQKQIQTIHWPILYDCSDFIQKHVKIMDYSQNIYLHNVLAGKYDNS